MLDAMPAGSVFMDLSTVLPETTDRLVWQRPSRGTLRRCAHRPLRIMDIRWRAFMVGASDENLERVRPVLRVATTILHIAVRLKRTRTKLVNNFLRWLRPSSTPNA
ncbi:MAG: hypothetical protein R3C97_05485 [Geminicoccaceae bacterium]